jgi:hypothetical protein
MSDFRCVFEIYLATMFTMFPSSAGKGGKGTRFLQRYRLEMEIQRDRDSTLLLKGHHCCPLRSIHLPLHIMVILSLPNHISNAPGTMINASIAAFQTSFCRGVTHR